MSETAMTAPEKIFRASGIGGACPRKLWFKAVAGIEEGFTTETLRIFDVGHALESVALRWMEQDGWIVDANPGSQEAGTELVIPVCDGVAIHGHHDAICWKEDEPDRKILVDVKTMKSRAFTLWKKNGTRAQYPQYLIQTSLYAWALGLKEVAIAAVNKDTSEFLVEVMPRDDEMVKATIEKARMIAESEEEPAVPEDLPAWMCNYCGYKREGYCNGF